MCIFSCSYGKIYTIRINNNTRINSVFHILTTVNFLLPTPVWPINTCKFYYQKQTSLRNRALTAATFSTKMS